MGIFASEEGEGATKAERIALIGILCFAFSWIPIFIVWKIISVCREHYRSPEQEVAAGNMPVTTNPPKPNRDSFQPAMNPQRSHRPLTQSPIPERESMGMSAQPQSTDPREPQTIHANSPLEEHRGRRQRMPTQPAEPMMRMMPHTMAILDDGLMDQDSNNREPRPKATELKPSGGAARFHPYLGGRGSSSQQASQARSPRGLSHGQQRRREYHRPQALEIRQGQSEERHPDDSLPSSQTTTFDDGESHTSSREESRSPPTGDRHAG